MPFLAISQNLRLFYLSPINYDFTSEGAFISLTDERIWTDENIEMANNDIYWNEKGNNEEQILKGIKRSDFLNAVQINESNSIFIFNMLLDTVLIYKIKETHLIERPNTYSGIEVGFKITNINLDLMGEYYWNTFVYIGNSNPFQTGKVYPIRWKQVDSTLFPNNIKSTNHKEWYDSFSRGKVFQFKTNDYTYLIQNLESSTDRPEGRHIIVFQDNTDTLVFNQIYMDTESTGLSPLITENENIQWTGQIFKDKPAVIYGFLWISFGCPWIDFIGGKEPSIYILCDNRH